MEEQIKNMSSGCKNQHVDDLTELKAEIQEITANIQVWISQLTISEAQGHFCIVCVSFLPQVTNTELSLFQRKLEEEVKKDQKEKRENQDVLKSLKMDKERLMEEQQRCRHTGPHIRSHPMENNQFSNEVTSESR